jgi:hypothetical protein
VQRVCNRDFIFRSFYAMEVSNGENLRSTIVMDCDANASLQPWCNAKLNCRKWDNSRRSRRIWAILSFLWVSASYCCSEYIGRS